MVRSNPLLLPLVRGDTRPHFEAADDVHAPLLEHLIVPLGLRPPEGALNLLALRVVRGLRGAWGGGGGGVKGEQHGPRGPGGRAVKSDPQHQRGSSALQRQDWDCA